MISTAAVGDAADVAVLVADSTVDEGEALLVWEDMIGEPFVPSIVVDNAAIVVTLVVGDTVPTVTDSFSMSNPLTVEDASVKTALI